MEQCNNYFVHAMARQDYIIQDNKIYLTEKIQNGQYILIRGSVFNNGVYKIRAVGKDFVAVDDLVDETFYGVIYSLAIPKQFLDLTNRIESFDKQNKVTNTSSESFGNYSYSKVTDGAGNVQTWQGIFKQELIKYKQIYNKLDGRGITWL
jgi:hypothetical protein